MRKPPRGCAIFIGVLLAIIALVAVFIGRGGLGEGSFISGRGSKEVTGVIGSEKREYFEDPEVVDRLTELGFTVNFTTAGSRRIANETNLAQQDFVFPSSGPAAQKITDQDSNYSVEYPFFSPMAVATFKPIARILEKEGVATEAAGKYTLDVGEFITLTQQGKRWRDFGNTFPSQRNVQVATTDIRTSNSAAMWLAILAWEFGESNPDKADDIGWLTNQIAPFFTGQGYTQSSSAGPFADYLSQGMGAVPMVLVYEAQFLGEQMKESSRIKDDMVLMHLEPTVLANHGIVGISPEGKELAQALASDQELQQLAARHGFRPATGDYLTTAMEGHGLGSPAHYDNSVDPPSFDRMEKLIEGVGNRYGSVPPRNREEQEK
ncbi:hypothetical protein KBX17_10205 [Corynebacterium sp. CCUG 65737]|nr:hypothetical protein [Corynebacterium sp. CCUG 65737]